MEKRQLLQCGSSLSGMVSLGSKMYMISDEYYTLGIYDYKKNEEQNLQFNSEMNERLRAKSYIERKKFKPDFESITSVELNGCQYLHVLPSFSSSARTELYLLKLKGEEGIIAPVNFSEVFSGEPLPRLHALLSERLAETNIEGHFISNGDLFLIHRGNKNSSSALIKINNYFSKLIDFVTVDKSFEFSAEEIELTVVNLPSKQGHNLQWTEGHLKNNCEIYFLATIEKTANAYDDGEVVASYIGEYNFKTQKVNQVNKLINSEKAEGFSIVEDKLYFCTDPDRENGHAYLYSAYLEDVLQNRSK